MVLAAESEAVNGDFISIATLAAKMGCRYNLMVFILKVAFAIFALSLVEVLAHIGVVDVVMVAGCYQHMAALFV